MDDLHLLHMAINMNINLLTCEQIKLCSMLKMIKNYEFTVNYSVDGLLDASTLLKCTMRKTNEEYTLKVISWL